MWENVGLAAGFATRRHAAIGAQVYPSQHQAHQHWPALQSLSIHLWPWVGVRVWQWKRVANRHGRLKASRKGLCERLLLQTMHSLEMRHPLGSCAGGRKKEATNSTPTPLPAGDVAPSNDLGPSIFEGSWHGAWGRPWCPRRCDILCVLSAFEDAC